LTIDATISRSMAIPRQARQSIVLAHSSYQHFMYFYIYCIFAFSAMCRIDPPIDPNLTGREGLAGPNGPAFSLDSVTEAHLE